MSLPQCSPLRRLLDILTTAVGKIEEQYATAGAAFPSLDEHFNPTNPNEALALNPEVLENSMLVVAAADQLAASVRLPAMTLWDLSMGFHISSSMHTVTKGNIPEILREGDSKGVHVKDIAAKNGMNPDKISRLLRLLATHHVFREVEPDVWANNRLSSILDTHKPTSELFSNPSEKYVQTPGVTALIEHSTDEVMKGSGILAEHLTNPESANSEDPTDSALIRHFQADVTYFEWLNTPGNEYRRTRFDVAMRGVSKLDDGQSVLKGFPWEELPDGAKVVDIGGGLGSISLTIAKQFPQLKFTIQDMPSIVKQSEDFWDTNLPDARKTGRVVFQGHNFFTPQPPQEADVFLLRMITHDWATSYVIKILRHLRAIATTGKTKLLVLEQITAYACKDTSEASNIPGAALPPVPEPLLPNLGRANSLMYLSDLQMLTVFQGEERTLGNHVHVMSEAGWKLVRIYNPPGSIHRQLVAEAVDWDHGRS